MLAILDRAFVNDLSRTARRSEFMLDLGQPRRPYCLLVEEFQHVFGSETLLSIATEFLGPTGGFAMSLLVMYI
jgi:hypothetical protein